MKIQGSVALVNFKLKYIAEDIELKMVSSANIKCNNTNNIKPHVAPVALYF